LLCGELVIPRLVGKLVFGQEADLAALNPQDVFGEVDACLVGFEHVQAK
jgi:hypothetical protein